MTDGLQLPRRSDLGGLMAAAQRLAAALRETNCRVVFAESCTAGLIPATLAAFPGISEYLCGSKVVYRNLSKQDWLGVSEQDLLDPGPVSETVAQQMAQGALRLMAVVLAS